MVAVRDPIHNGLFGVFPVIRIPKHAMRHPFLEGLKNFRGGLEIHIRHPQGENIVFLKNIPLGRFGAAPVGEGIEIVMCHWCSFSLVNV